MIELCGEEEADPGSPAVDLARVSFARESAVNMSITPHRLALSHTSRCALLTWQDVFISVLFHIFFSLANVSGIDFFRLVFGR